MWKAKACYQALWFLTCVLEQSSVPSQFMDTSAKQFYKHKASHHVFVIIIEEPPVSMWIQIQKKHCWHGVLHNVWRKLSYILLFYIDICISIIIYLYNIYYYHYIFILHIIIIIKKWQDTKKCKTNIYKIFLVYHI